VRKTIALSFLLLLIGMILGFVLSLVLPAIYVLVYAILWGTVPIIFIWLRAPLLAKEAWTAEEEDGVLVLMHGDDHRIVPLASYYYKKRGLVEPITRLKNLVWIPDPNSTIPVQGQKSRIALAYVNFPYLLNQDYIIVAYDLKRMGLANIGQALDYAEYYDKVEEFEQRIKEYEGFLKELEKYNSLAELPEELKEKLPEDLQAEHATDDDFFIYKQQLREYIMDMYNVLRHLKKKKKPKPIVKIGARIYSIKDILGYLGYQVRLSKLSSVKEYTVTETLRRTRSKYDTAIKYGIIIMFAFIGLIAFIMALNYLGAHVGLPQPQQLPNPFPIPTTTPSVQHVNITGNITG